MANRRGRVNKPDPLDVEVSLPALRHVSDDRDPREPLSIGAAAQEPAKPTTGVAVRMGQTLDSKRLLTKYCNNLVAKNGDKVAALAETFGISEEEAARDMIALHDRVVGASKVTSSVSELFDEHDINMPVRLAKLRDMMFSPKEAVSLKAMDMINDLDATVKSKRIGTTWEQLIERVRAKSERDLKRKKPEEV